MTGTDLCVNLATSVPVIFEPTCSNVKTLGLKQTVAHSTTQLYTYSYTHLHTAR